MSAHDDPNWRPETLAVRAGYDPASGNKAAKPPIYMTTTFAYASAQQAKDIHEAYFDGTGPEVGGAGHIYARLSHPGLDMVETRLAALDGAESAAVFNSGMATHSAIALAHLRPGDSVVFSRPIYGGTNGLYTMLMPGFGVHQTSFADGCDEDSIMAAVDAALAHGPLKLIVIESPANPTAAIVDIALVVAIADAVGTATGLRPLVVVDNTLLGPMMQRPIALGADLCMTSLTKYCGGHSDLMAGGVTGKAALIAPLRLLRTTLGSHLDPYNCWLLLRSMETVHLRVDRAMDNARTIAEFLRDHPKVVGITYLGFLAAGTPQRAVYDRQCRAGGSTFSFAVAGDEAAAFRFLDRLRLLRFAVSLGGSETLITHPATTTHYALTPEERAIGGITPATLRLSVGIEHVDDLIADLAQALEAV
ncbi:aminotransferase class I/II-fold pyridoxal phosphate-dependent enzyme [Sphingomonas sp. AR_OL41]|uniref:aminotransferase class I/II-fold pyridoxal phosphate-dependent enzyme n=1 Tax=Sphingomonas sp. AR_OL41 TaxID=3042729 RepID=UPI0024816E57|nr:aminotransferase class I/II-fold pyridoxal phosphate-dependent enzyme [Sphingomonas sp. AR_OL41]MDH7971958.1 aminotransferase class I/II-fold pyridoxal phosphate-dependent enzyme [Sphingomonas sp. AR_OL41]